MDLPPARKRLLLSWSGEPSRDVAILLRRWLPTVLPSVEPWMSAEDIGAGSRWFEELLAALEDAAACVVCLTADNAASPWLHFEAGAVAAGLKGRLLCPYLCGIDEKAIGSLPLSQYQAVGATRQGTRKLVGDLNGAFGSAHGARALTTRFGRAWPALERGLDLLTTSRQLPALSVPARTLLLAVSRHPRTPVVLRRTTQGRHYPEVGGRSFGDKSDLASLDRWQRAVNELVTRGLLTRVAGGSSSFTLSRAGRGLAQGATTASRRAV